MLLYSSGLKHAARERVQCGPPTSGKIKILKKILSQFVYFSKTLSFLIMFFLHFLMRPARHFEFETPALQEEPYMKIMFPSSLIKKYFKFNYSVTPVSLNDTLGEEGWIRNMPKSVTYYLNGPLLL